MFSYFNKPLAVLVLFFTTITAFSQTYTFSRETITKLKFVGKQSWEEQRVLSSPGNNYLMTYTELSGVFQANIRDFNSLQHHYFEVFTRSNANEKAFKYLNTKKISYSNPIKNQNLPKKISYEDAANGERKILVEVFKDKKQTKRFRKWELIYVPVNQEIPSWWHLNMKFKLQPHFEFDSPVQILRGKFYEGDSQEPLEFELQSIEEVEVKVVVP